ncbi:MAG: MsnO8 family LLM class oxidoreductase, partial [Alphaproteobacteria bacterium]|nr:MsnO8 family LLM class oxidoreductase [Alphaproteobacteria bacterium]
PLQPGQLVQAVPGAGTNVPLWMLGSSLYGAEVAAAFGLPYAFAAQFAPALLIQALSVYREKFQPSQQLARPHVMIGVNVVVADSDAEARYLFTSVQQAFLNMKRGSPGKLPPPVEQIAWSDAEEADVAATLACSFVGTPATIRPQLENFIAQTGADEIIAVTSLFDHAPRLKSYEVLAAIAKTLA